MIGTKITDETKILLTHKNQIVLAFAGLRGVAKDVLKNLELNRAFNQSKELYAAVDALGDMIANIRSKYLKRHTFQEDEMIIEAIACGLSELNSGEPRLYRVDQKGYHEIISKDSSEPFCTLGSARDYADSLMRLCYDREMEKQKISEILAYVIHQCSLVDTNVGGKPDLAFSERNKIPSLIESNETEALMGKAKNYSETVTRVLKRLFGADEAFSTFLKHLFERDESYKIFGESVIEDLVGIRRFDRKTLITLEYTNDLRIPLIEGRIESEYVARNLHHTQKDLFLIEGERGLVSKGSVTIPSDLKKSQIPIDPTRFWDVAVSNKHSTGLQVNGQDRIPKKKVWWKDSKNHDKGVNYELFLNESIDPDETKKVFWATRCVYGKNDYIVRRFSNYGNDAEIEVRKPPNLELMVTWFLQVGGERSPNVKLQKAEVSPTCYKQKVVGSLAPGNGFVVIWWPRRDQ